PDESDCSQHTKTEAGDSQSKDSSNQSKRNIQKYQRSLLCRIKRIKEQRKDEQHTHGHDQRQPFHRTLLVLEFAAPGYVVAGRKFDLIVEAILHFSIKNAHVSVFYETS